jgi:glycosyltransferase involved in cell wall biosynthesis
VATDVSGGGDQPGVIMANRRVLMIAAHVPPYSVGSGYLRTLKFCDYLPACGWDPVILAPSNRAFPPEQLSPGTEKLLTCPVKRSFALDSARHLSIRGRYPDILAAPDRWSTWWLSAVFAGLRLVRKHRPAAIFSTYPIATAQLIGLTLARLTGLPWVADFRDPMIDTHHPPPGAARRARAAIERQTLRRCSAATFTTESTLTYYGERFADRSDAALRLVMNGYDERDFPAKVEGPAQRGAQGRPLELLHSGLLYRDIRDPTALFQALAALKQEGVITADSLRVRLRASGPDGRYRPLLAELDIADIVDIEPGIPYREALAEMCAVDGLLLLQGADANKQVPAKLFEYLRAGAPILALVHPEGDTARILAKSGAGRLTRMDDADEIRKALHDFVTDPQERARWATPEHVAASFSREASAQGLAAVLDEAVDKHRRAGHAA